MSEERQPDVTLGDNLVTSALRWGALVDAERLAAWYPYHWQTAEQAGAVGVVCVSSTDGGGPLAAGFLPEGTDLAENGARPEWAPVTADVMSLMHYTSSIERVTLQEILDALDNGAEIIFIAGEVPQEVAGHHMAGDYGGQPGPVI